MSIDVRAPIPPGAATAVEAAFAILDAADRRFSPYRVDSELSRINRGERLVASPEMVEVLGLAEDARVASGGAFDCHDPSGRLDTNGIVKGWAAQRAADALVGGGISSFCLNAGGDVVVRGAPEPGRRWHVAVRSPTGDDPLAVLALQDAAVATSGSVRAGGPHLGSPSGARRPPTRQRDSGGRRPRHRRCAGHHRCSSSAPKGSTGRSPDTDASCWRWTPRGTAHRRRPLAAAGPGRSAAAR